MRGARGDLILPDFSFNHCCIGYERNTLFLVVCTVYTLQVIMYIMTLEGHGQPARKGRFRVPVPRLRKPIGPRFSPIERVKSETQITGNLVYIYRMPHIPRTNETCRRGVGTKP